MSTNNYAAEDRIREKLATVRDLQPTAVEDIITRFQLGQFAENNLDGFLVKCRESDNFGHWFRDAVAAEAADALATDAFARGNLTARGKLARQMTPAELDMLAQSYGLRDAKDFRRGTPPQKPGETPKAADSKNPWSKHPENLDARGKYNARAITRQSQIAKSDFGLATRLAAICGVRVGSTRPAA